MNAEKEKIRRCPRCGGNQIMDYGEIIECLDCKLEFQKIDFKLVEDKARILAIQEKKAFIDSFKKLFEPEK